MMIASILVIPIVIGQCLLVLYILCRVLYWWTRSSNPLLFKDGKQCIAFFHPYCNAGGGGERVLWCAVRAVQKSYPNLNCIIYTGDLIAGRVSGDDILKKAVDRFNITIPKPVTFIPIKRRWLLEAKIYPHFTLLGQSIGSVLVGFEAMCRFTPDIYIDTMGYAFTLPLFRYLAGCRVGCYVHYPTISTDMLDVVSSQTPSFNNAGYISRSRLLTLAKLCYYKLFAGLYSLCGQCSEVVMVNSSWTKAHIGALWSGKQPQVVYPPCDVEQFLDIRRDSNESSHDMNEVRIVSVAQFRPEKDHPLQLHALRTFLSREDRVRNIKLVLIGGCRDEEDERRVEQLREMTRKLALEPHVEFLLNIPFNELKREMSRALIGLHTMRNEHFGIGIVELQAAGCLVIAHNSGGPRMDIVTDPTASGSAGSGPRTGFLADCAESYADAIHRAVRMSAAERGRVIRAAREGTHRFDVATFETDFIRACQEILTGGM